MKKYIFEGGEYIKGLHGIPDYAIYKNTNTDFWFWRKGSQKEDNHFLPILVFQE